MKIKSFFLVSIAMVMAMSMIGCGKTSDNSEELTSKKNIRLDETEFVEFGGRVLGNVEDGYEIFNTASEFSIKTDSINLFATMSGSAVSEGVCYVAVLVDGERVKTIELGQDKKEYTLYENEDGKEHKVTLIKITEAQYSFLTVYDIKGDGNFYKIERSEKEKIVFYGDSITCGYGNIDDPKVMTYYTKGQDGSKTYATYCADKLNADIDVLAASGWAIVKASWHTTDMRIPRVFDKYSPLEDEKYINGVDTKTNYVVVNLGTNDYTYYANHQGDLKEFEDAYYDFYTELRTTYPFAEIILTIGMMNFEHLISVMEPYVVAVKDRALADGDTKVSYKRLYTATLNEDFGANGHPSVLAQEKAGEELYQYILSLNNSN